MVVVGKRTWFPKGAELSLSRAGVKMLVFCKAHQLHEEKQILINTVPKSLFFCLASFFFFLSLCVSLLTWLTLAQAWKVCSVLTGEF